MRIVMFVLALVVLFAFLGIVVHLLWILAVVFAVFWVGGWALAKGEGAGSRRRWYGRW